MSALETAKAANLAMSAHITQCLTCASADRWALMCEPGKTLYDDMVAATYAAMNEGRNR